MREDLILCKDTFNKECNVSYLHSEIPRLASIDEAFDFLLSPDHFKRVFESRTTPKVLGVFEGPYFVLNGKSRNKRYYPESLWVKSVFKNEEFLRRLSDGILGTYDHPEEKFQYHSSLSSHVTKELYRDGNFGVGKSYILPTPMGGIVATLATLKDEKNNPLINFYVSTRGYGKYLNKRVDGDYIVMDEDNYYLEAFDIVHNPGFLEAKPKFEVVLREAYSLYNLPEITSTEVGNKRDDSVNESINLSTKREVSNMTDQELLAKYKELGSPEEIEELIQASDTLAEEVESLRAEKELNDMYVDVIDSYFEAYDPEQVAEVYSLVEEYGSPESIREALSVAKEMVEEAAIKKFAETHRMEESRAKKILESVDFDIDKAEELIPVFTGKASVKEGIVRNNESLDIREVIKRLVM